jgi:hypothetical protein
MSNRILLSMGVAGMILASASQAFSQAQQRNCGSRDQIVTALTDRYGESRQSIGLGTNNQVIEVYASLDTGTWTITVTMPDGRMCLVASGQAYEAVADALPARGSDA